MHHGGLRTWLLAALAAVTLGFGWAGAQNYVFRARVGPPAPGTAPVLSGVNLPSPAVTGAAWAGYFTVTPPNASITLSGGSFAGSITINQDSASGFVTLSATAPGVAGSHPLTVTARHGGESASLTRTIAVGPLDLSRVSRVSTVGSLWSGSFDIPGGAGLEVRALWEGATVGSLTTDTNSNEALDDGDVWTHASAGKLRLTRSGDTVTVTTFDDGLANPDSDRIASAGVYDLTLTVAGADTPLTLTAIGTVKLTAGVDAENEAYFGVSVALTESLGLVGAFLETDDSAGARAGAAYLFDMEGVRQRKLASEDLQADDRFGAAVALNDSFALIGVPGEDGGDDDVPEDAGAAYLFDLATGEQLAKLVAADADADEEFGNAVALSDTHAVVAAHADSENGNRAGAVYLFALSAIPANPPDGFVLTAPIKMIGHDIDAGDRFGNAVAINRTHVLAASETNDEPSTNAGGAYLFDLTGSQIAKLQPADSESGDYFGSTVALSDTHALVGAKFDDDPPDSPEVYSSGAAYLFDLASLPQNPPAGYIHTEATRLIDSDIVNEGFFGGGAALNTTHALVGRDNPEGNNDQPIATYLFDLTGAQVARLAAPDIPLYSHESFGAAGALNSRFALVGAAAREGAQGAAYLIPLEPFLDTAE